MILTLATIAIMITWIPVFIFSEYKWGEKNYFYTKTFSSLLFLTIGLLGHFSAITPSSYSLFILAALTFGLVGDVLLVFSDKHICFLLGLISFLIGQIVYGVLFLMNSGFLLYDLILYIAIVLLSLLAYKKSNLNPGKMKFPALFYLLAISFMYTMALSTIYKQAYTPLTTLVIVVGSTLFALSDMVLSFSMFTNDAEPVLKRVNIGLYFYGQMLLAASIITFV